MNSKIFLLYTRVIQGQTGGNLIALELMGQVAFPYKRKDFLFHRGCSFAITSILKSGLIAGGRESKDGRQTIFFTPSQPVDEEEPSDDLSKPRKYTITVSGKLIRTPSIGSIEPEHKTNDDDSGRQGLMR